MKHNAFSLLELSIVLVIIGLIAGGIVAGSSMIRAAELRAAITEKEQYNIAANTFRDKYLAIPGDMKNATSFWGRADTGATSGQCATPTTDTAASGTGTCNGTGDSQALTYTTTNAHEGFRFWEHLSNAELVSGTFTGVTGSAGTHASTLNENVPESKITGAAWGAEYMDLSSGLSTVSYNINYGNTLLFGRIRASDGIITEPTLSPVEAWTMDKKTDDGKPGYGNMIVINVADCTTGTDNTNRDVDYDLELDTELCAFRFSKQF